MRKARIELRVINGRAYAIARDSKGRVTAMVPANAPITSDIQRLNDTVAMR